MEYGKKYAVLASIGDYRKMNICNLDTYEMDSALMFQALTRGLKFDSENIRFLGEKGVVSAKEFALAIKHFSTMLTTEDSLVFYFSGHGRNNELIFSDISISLNSVLTYIDRLSCKNKVVILDCCFSGDFSTDGPRQISFEESINSFVGHGIAVMASSAANEVSRLGANYDHSLYTGIVSAAMLSRRHVRKGCISLDDINSEVFQLMEQWNRQHGALTQHPIYRSCIGGTIYYKVDEKKEYKVKQIYLETNTYIVCSVKPLSSLNIKRLCAFVIPKKEVSPSDLTEITKDIARKIKYENVFSTANSEARHKNKSACAIWCYFGKDESDISHSLYFAYTIWAKDAKYKKMYFRDNRNACVINDIYFFQNNSYEMIRRMQSPKMTREEFIRENKKLLTTIISLAATFIYDIQEVENKLLDIEAFQEKYRSWIQEVKKQFFLLSETEVAPDDLVEWAEEIMSLAGCVLDLAILIEGEIGDREKWLLHNSIRYYNLSLEAIGAIGTGY